MAFDPCKSKRSGRPLSSYFSKADAQEAADYGRKNYRSAKLKPYKCDRCGSWHLAPQDRHTPSETCTVCRGSDGKLKESYPTPEIAQRRAKILRREQGVELTVYECEHGKGWHLTKLNS